MVVEGDHEVVEEGEHLVLAEPGPLQEVARWRLLDPSARAPRGRRIGRLPRRQERPGAGKRTVMGREPSARARATVAFISAFRSVAQGCSVNSRRWWIWPRACGQVVECHEGFQPSCTLPTASVACAPRLAWMAECVNRAVLATGAQARRPPRGPRPVARRGARRSRRRAALAPP